MTTVQSTSYRAPGSQSSGTSGYLQAAKTAFDVHSLYKSDLRDEQKLQATCDRIGLAVADFYTAGMASLFYGWASKQWGGTMQKIREFDAKWNIGTRIITKLFTSDKWATEGDRLRTLMKNGVLVPEGLPALHQTRGLKKSELIDQTVPETFRGYTADGRWVNNAFASTRDERYLTPQDIVGYAAFFERFGSDWAGAFSTEQRFKMAQKALDLGCVREHHGTLDVTWSKALEAEIALLRTERNY